MEPIGRGLLLLGVLLVVVGLVLAIGPRIPLLGHLPGDIRIDRGNVKVFIPLGTMLLVSVILSLVLTVIGRSR